MQAHTRGVGGGALPGTHPSLVRALTSFGMGPDRPLMARYACLRVHKKVAQQKILNRPFNFAHHTTLRTLGSDPTGTMVLLHLGWQTQRG